MSQLLRRLNGIVLSQREEVHAPPLETHVNFPRVAITLTAKFSYKGGRAEARVVRVDVHIALHSSHNRMPLLIECDAAAKVLKTQIFNSFDTYF